MAGTRNAVLNAHDIRRRDLLEWVRPDVPGLRSTPSSPPDHQGAGEGLTGLAVPDRAAGRGPAGGGQDLERDLDVLLEGPLEPQPHAAGFQVGSPLLHGEHGRAVEKKG